MLSNTGRLTHTQCFQVDILILCQNQMPAGRQQTIFCKTAIAAGTEIIIILTLTELSDFTRLTFPTWNQWKYSSLFSNQRFILRIPYGADGSAEFMPDYNRIYSGTQLIYSRYI